MSPFLKITIADLKAYPKVRNAFERGEVSFRNLFDGKALTTYESNIAYTLRFMIDHQAGSELDVRRSRLMLMPMLYCPDHRNELDRAAEGHLHAA